MSTVVTTGSSLKSTNLPAALLEACLLLDAAEKARNGQNPGLPAKNFLTLTISSDEGLINISAALPSEVTLGTDGSIVYNAKDYLGATYSAFTPGGAVTATTRQDAVVMLAQILSNAEKLVQPVEDQPNFVQLESSSEAGTITINATLPYSALILASGAIEITAMDYL